MHEVYDSRKGDIEMKATFKGIEKDQKELEKEILNKAVAAYEAELEQKRIQVYLVRQHKKNECYSTKSISILILFFLFFKSKTRLTKENSQGR